jgi:hypothetical protein
MRYLQNRSDFLERKIQFDRSKLNDYIKGSEMIRETLENEITWGGSLIGRLINSAIRKVKIGTKQVQIPPLLDNLKTELDYLVSQSLQGKAKEKVDLLKLKTFMEQIKDECFRPSKDIKDEGEILKELIGDYGDVNQGAPASTLKDLYDPDKPKEKVETKALVQEVIDTLLDDFPDLKEILGINRDQILDALSDFNDELRKYYFVLLTNEETGGDTLSVSSSVKRFQQNFGNLYQAIQNKSKSTTPTTP